MSLYQKEQHVLEQIEQRIRYVYIAAGVMIGAGALAELLGYSSIRDEADPVLQLPYLMSGGIGGVFLLGLGATLAAVAWAMRHQMWQRELEERLDYLLDDNERLAAMLEELHHVLAAADIELQRTGPAMRTQAGRRRKSQVPAPAGDPVD